MGREQDRAARRFIHAAGFHADETVFDEIEAANAVCFAERVELGQKRCGRQFLAIDRNRVTFGKVDGDGCDHVGGVLRPDGAGIDVIGNFDGGIFQHFALGGGVQEIGIDGERGFAALVFGNRDLVGFRKGDERFTRAEIPFAPWGDDGDVGL